MKRAARSALLALALAGLATGVARTALGETRAAKAEGEAREGVAKADAADVARWFEAAREGDVATLRRLAPKDEPTSAKGAKGTKPSRSAKPGTTASTGASTSPAPTITTWIDRADASGYTALILAAYHDHREAVRWLLAGGASTCAVDRRGFTALMGAVFRGHLELVELLATKPCGADHVTPSGQTPLMLAALFGRLEICRTLLLAGADPTRRDDLGNDARSLAEGQGNAELVRLLDEHPRK